MNFKDHRRGIKKGKQKQLLLFSKVWQLHVHVKKMTGGRKSLKMHFYCNTTRWLEWWTIDNMMVHIIMTSTNRNKVDLRGIYYIFWKDYLFACLFVSLRGLERFPNYKSYLYETTIIVVFFKKYWKLNEQKLKFQFVEKNWIIENYMIKKKLISLKSQFFSTKKKIQSL
jgi:hypothetical protein